MQVPANGQFNNIKERLYKIQAKLYKINERLYKVDGYTSDWPVGSHNHAYTYG